MKPSDVLLEARTFLEERRHWIQGALTTVASDGTCRYCAYGAIEAMAKHDEPLIGRSCRYLRAVIGTDDIPWWNDHPMRVHFQVVAAFDAAIERARGEGQ